MEELQLKAATLKKAMAVLAHLEEIAQTVTAAILDCHDVLKRGFERISFS